MKHTTIVAALAALLISGAANAGNAGEGANSAECKEITTRLIRATNSTFGGYSPSGDNVFLKHPDMLLRCMTHRLTGVSLNWDDSGFPSNAWFKLVAKAGQAVTGVDVKTLEAASRKCHRLALKEQSSLADFDIHNAKIECQAFSDSGGGVIVSIFMNDHEARKGIEE